MKTLTVFTPTYNRAYCLHQVYESLCRQTSQDFLWLVIDDGSTDETNDLVASWKKEAKIEIHYHYKENGGMHTGHNVAYSLIDTELNVCIDSDDYMPEDAVELIIKKWKKEGGNQFAGILGLDIDKNGNVIGTKFPEDLMHCKYSELKRKHGVVGDIKFVYKTDIIKKYMPYPVFKGEKFVPLGYPYALIDKNYDMLCSNEIYCIVEYQPDGSTKNIIKQYINNPKGFAHERKKLMVAWPFFMDRFRFSIHYISSSIFLKNKNFIKESPRKIMTVFAIPFGVLLHLYILYLNKKNT
ncbi:MAG: glycosyltransferase [Bacteroidetes bacterium HGW-Bacteroidetes-2]|jgi:glycosyltransferase involved in cell wall biosynthesis|nr:MAG: glycosyltransferase [Bacteroidetes bacterium HGW-Bacteroidetes-2]